MPGPRSTHTNAHTHTHIRTWSRRNTQFSTTHTHLSKDSFDHTHTCQKTLLTHTLVLVCVDTHTLIKRAAQHSHTHCSKKKFCVRLQRGAHIDQRQTHTAPTNTYCSDKYTLLQKQTHTSERETLFKNTCERETLLKAIAVYFENTSQKAVQQCSFAMQQ